MMVMGDQGGRTAVANFLWICLDPFLSLAGRQKVLFSKYYYGPIVAPFASAADDDDESGGGVDIYIMKCVCVTKIITSYLPELSARGAKRDTC